MSHFRTPIPISKSPLSIDYHSPILAIGSCFAANIGGRLQHYKFPCLLNPFGILYNPISIKQNLLALLNKRLYTQEDLVNSQGIWYSFDHHGQFSHPTPQQTVTLINHSLETARSFLSSTKYLIITLGTAQVFVQNSSSRVVANCHKLPANYFTKRRLSVTEVQASLNDCLLKLQEVYKDLQIILTVSPIRHIRDGLIESQRSKATLLLATEQLCETHSCVHYFPAYELMMDDLRDYRFYESDMIHPTTQAVDYIWDAFKTTYFTESTLQLLGKIKKIRQASLHRPFHSDTPQHQAFVRAQLVRILALQQAYPFLDMEMEKGVFETQMRHQ